MKNIIFDVGADEYGFNLLLMDRKKVYLKSEFQIVNNMNDILEII